MPRHCSHGVLLPRGLKCSRGYLILTVRHKGRIVEHPGCGAHNQEAQILAIERLGKVRSEILRNKFGYAPDLPEKLFKDVVPLFLEHWKKERHGDGRLKHNERSIADCESAIERNLIPFFGKMKYHEIRATEVEARRDERLAAGVLGTTINREHVPLSSIFSKIADLMELGKIAKFKTPAKNPCEAATKAELRVHERLLSDYEIKKLRLACLTLNDQDAWEICKMILKSVLSVGDLQKLEVGQVIDLDRAKTGVPIKIPITMLQKLNWTNWGTRWKRIRREAGLSIDKRDSQYVDAKVLRKTGINWVREKFGIDRAGTYAAHASIRTTEKNYKVVNMEENRPTAEFMEKKVDDLETD